MNLTSIYTFVSNARITAVHYWTFTTHLLQYRPGLSESGFWEMTKHACVEPEGVFPAIPLRSSMTPKQYWKSLHNTPSDDTVPFPLESLLDNDSEVVSLKLRQLQAIHAPQRPVGWGCSCANAMTHISSPVIFIPWVQTGGRLSETYVQGKHFGGLGVFHRLMSPCFPIARNKYMAQRGPQWEPLDNCLSGSYITCSRLKISFSATSSKGLYRLSCCLSKFNQQYRLMRPRIHVNCGLGSPGACEGSGNAVFSKARRSFYSTSPRSWRPRTAANPCPRFDHTRKWRTGHTTSYDPHLTATKTLPTPIHDRDFKPDCGTWGPPRHWRLLGVWWFSWPDWPTSSWRSKYLRLVHCLRSAPTNLPKCSPSRPQVHGIMGLNEGICPFCDATIRWFSTSTPFFDRGPTSAFNPPPRPFYSIDIRIIRHTSRIF